jgi:arsenate reductase-like glutaredoxin family protein
LMSANPTLIKRPVIEMDGAVLVGWTAEAKAKCL